MDTPRLLSLLAPMSALALVVAAPGMARGQCVGSEPPSDACGFARGLSGNVGTQTVVMNTSTATANSEIVCGVPIGHSVWFNIIPSVSGILTFSTCHPSTTYDTVIDAFSGGDNGCDFMSPVACNEDRPVADCANGCSAYGSTLRFSVAAGTHYRLRVGSYNNNAPGCSLCLGVLVSLCDGELTPPSVTIASPSPQACVCPGLVPITGSIADSGSGVSSYELDFAPASGGAWTTVARGVGAASGILGAWNTLALSDEDYHLRLTARDGCGNSSTSIVTCRVDSAPDSVLLRSPQSGAVVGGTVVADGTIWDSCAASQAAVHWAPVSPSPVWTPFDTLNPPWIVNDPLGTWNTRTSVDGDYFIRATLITACGSGQYVMNTVAVDNTPPIALIASPVNCARFNRGTIQVRGTAADANLASWTLRYTGGPANGWVTIASGTSPVINGVLANWNTAALPWCPCTLSLTVTDRAVIEGNPNLHNTAEFQTTVAVGCVADVNGDVAVTPQDIFDFLSAYFGACP
ncbi:MAG: hypothetical protein ACK4WH_06965 [Phycisphaerales bacterium]